MPLPNRREALFSTGVKTIDNCRRAVFLDRDGVINRRRLDHVKSWEEFEFLPGVLVAMAALKRSGWRTVVITNQSAVGRGMMTQAQLAEIHFEMSRAVTRAGGAIDAIYACPHTPENRCGCRKPAIGLFTQASAELDVSLPDSFMIGDSLSDIVAARRAGCRPILVAGLKALEPGADVSQFSDLMSAIAVIDGLTRSEVV